MNWNVGIAAATTCPIFLLASSYHRSWKMCACAWLTIECHSIECHVYACSIFGIVKCGYPSQQNVRMLL